MKIEIQKFDDLSECTEYFYDELGKLNAVQQIGYLNKKEVKKLHNIVMNSFLSVMGNLKFKADITNKIEKVTTKEVKEEFQKEHSIGLIQKTMKVIKRTSSKVGEIIGTTLSLIVPKSKRISKVEVLTEEETKKLSRERVDSFSQALPEGEKKEDLQQDKNNNKELSQNEGKID